MKALSCAWDCDLEFGVNKKKYSYYAIIDVIFSLGRKKKLFLRFEFELLCNLFKFFVIIANLIGREL